MAKYRMTVDAEQVSTKRVEAYLFNDDPLPKDVETVRSDYNPERGVVYRWEGRVRTPQGGALHVDTGDWIVRGPGGMVTVMKDNEFRATYESVD